MHHAVQVDKAPKMSVKRVLMAALVAILVTTTSAQDADARQVLRLHRGLRITAYTWMFYTGLFAAVTLQPAMTSQVRHFNDHIITYLPAIPDCQPA